MRKMLLLPLTEKQLTVTVEITLKLSGLLEQQVAVNQVT